MKIGVEIETNLAFDLHAFKDIQILVLQKNTCHQQGAKIFGSHN